MKWARLLKHVFDIDLEHCPNCGGVIGQRPDANRRSIRLFEANGGEAIAVDYAANRRWWAIPWVLREIRGR